MRDRDPAEAHNARTWVLLGAGSLGSAAAIRASVMAAEHAVALVPWSPEYVGRGTTRTRWRP
jgi:hypothetical protein